MKLDQTEDVLVHSGTASEGRLTAAPDAHLSSVTMRTCIFTHAHTHTMHAHAHTQTGDQIW